MKLLAVQQAAREAARGHSGFGYFMEQGLGKTLVDLSEFVDQVQAGEVSRGVVICPNSFKSGWVDEIIKWQVPVEPFIFQSGNKASHDWWIRRRYDAPPLLIVNYDAIRSEQTREYVMQFAAGARRGARLTFDESIQIADHQAKQTKAAIALAKEFEYSRILSGKPTRNGPHDLWSQMRAAKQLDGLNYHAFRTRYCRMGGFKGKQVVGVQNPDQLARLINPHVFRATKADWTDLPPKSYTSREYQLSGDVKEHYDQMEAEFLTWLADGTEVSVDSAITKYIKLAQIQCGFIINERGGAVPLVPDKQNPRLKLLRQIVDDEVTGKITVVYTNRYVLEQLQRVLADLNPAKISGGMTDEEISAEKRRFNEDPRCRAILLQTRAAKYGHTLLGGPEPENRCYTQIIYQNTYSLDDRSQIEDRIHRHGQVADGVLYIDLVGTELDRGAVDALQRKEDIFQAIFAQLARSKA